MNKINLQFFSYSAAPAPAASRPAFYGPLMMVLSAVLFSTGGILCKLIPWSALAINGVRNLLGGLLIGLYLLATHHKLRFNFTVFIGAVCMCGVTSFFIIANKLTTAANAIVLQYTAPVWIILIMAVFLHQKPKKGELITMVFVLAGIVCFFVDSLSQGSFWGNAAAIAAGLFYAGLFTLNSFPDGDGLSSLFIGQLGTGIIFTPLVFREQDFSPVPVIAVIVLGLFQVGLAYLFFYMGTKYTSPVAASLIAGIEPVLNPLIVAVFWHEVLTPLALVGAVIVVASILIYNVGSSRASG